MMVRVGSTGRPMKSCPHIRKCKKVGEACELCSQKEYAIMIRIPIAHDSKIIRCTKIQNWANLVRQQRQADAHASHGGGLLTTHGHHFSHNPAQGSLGPHPAQMMPSMQHQAIQAAQSPQPELNFNHPLQMNALGPPFIHPTPQQGAYQASGSPMNLPMNPAGYQPTLTPSPVQYVDPNLPNSQANVSMPPQPYELYSNNDFTEQSLPNIVQPTLDGQMLSSPMTQSYPSIPGQPAIENFDNIMMNNKPADGLTLSHDGPTDFDGHYYPNLFYMPPGLATAEHPFTAGHQAQYEHNAQHYPLHMLFHAPTGIAGEAAPPAEGYTAPGHTYECICGPGCQCIFCLAHPFNAPTQQVVQQLARLAEQDNNASEHADAGRSTSSGDSRILSESDQDDDTSGSGTALSSEYHTFMYNHSPDLPGVPCMNPDGICQRGQGCCCGNFLFQTNDFNDLMES
ncbi:MAG: hypothetical protein Q9220_005661 [cf. Caloplaca sp. 1 TL-2023]